jgi:ferredoxin--NADP+ reductase
MSLRVAIVGSGPSGFYTAEALLKADDSCQIDIIERLAAPFGLIRGGVAPDHQSTKRVMRTFERTALQPQVGYYGNVELGREVSVDELCRLYDAVVLAVGTPVDRPMGIPGEDKKGVFGAAAFVGWYNGEPDFRDLDPDLDTKAAAVIGVGNVALDVARVLVKTPQELATSDIADYAAEAIRRSPLTEVYVLGRRGPLEAKFSNVELREMGELAACGPEVDPAQLPDAVPEGEPDRDRRVREKNLQTLRGFAAARPDRLRKRVHFWFCRKPVEVLGGDRVAGLRLEKTEVVDGRAIGTGAYVTVDCGLVIAAIGYRARPIEGLPFDQGLGTVVNADGRVGDGLYAVGWIKRGPTGVIGTNKADGAVAARQIVADIAAGRKPGRPAFEALLRERGVRWVSYRDWQVIDKAEVANARPGAPRRKFVTLDEMLSVLDRAASGSA